MCYWIQRHRCHCWTSRAKWRGKAIASISPNVCQRKWTLIMCWFLQAKVYSVNEFRAWITLGMDWSATWSLEYAFHINFVLQWDENDFFFQEIDIAVAPMKMTAEREEVIDFVAPYYEQTGILIGLFSLIFSYVNLNNFFEKLYFVWNFSVVGAVIRKPVRQTSLFKFMTVLRVEVWLSIVGAIVTTSIMLWLLDKYSPYSAQVILFILKIWFFPLKWVYIICFSFRKTRSIHQITESKNNKEAYQYPCR